MPEPRPTRQRMLNRIARYATLRHEPKSYIDNVLPGHVRENLMLVGDNTGGRDAEVSHPLGAAELTMGMQRAEPGNGPGLHHHDATEVFTILAGRWRLYWVDEEGEGSAELEPFDTASIPPRVWRGLEVVGEAPGVLLGVRHARDGGGITWHPDVLAAARDAGRELVDGQLVETGRGRS